MRNYNRLALHKKVLVSTVTGRTFRGVLFETRGDLIVLRNTELLDDGQVVSVDGSVIIERGNIDFMQVVGN